jgi:alkylation response protein AidB-like acyl-CoA dehydrogenase
MPLTIAADDPLRRRWLPAVAKGEAMAAFALTEPEAGSDVASLKTSARRDGDSYLLNGAKTLISNAGIADFYLVFAVTDPEKGKKGISAFIVPTHTDGYQVARIEEKMGQHASDTCQIVFDNCRIPAANLLGKEGEGYKIALANL